MIRKIQVSDKRFPLVKGAGSDVIHRDPIYSYAVTRLIDDNGFTGVGFAFTLDKGNDLVYKAAQFCAERLKGKDIGELMSDFGTIFNQLSNEQQFRWSGA
jgi:L-fuconate dehydratase